MISAHSGEEEAGDARCGTSSLIFQTAESINPLRHSIAVTAWHCMHVKLRTVGEREP